VTWAYIYCSGWQATRSRQQEPSGYLTLVEYRVYKSYALPDIYNRGEFNKDGYRNKKVCNNNDFIHRGLHLHVTLLLKKNDYHHEKIGVIFTNDANVALKLVGFDQKETCANVSFPHYIYTSW